VPELADDRIAGTVSGHDVVFFDCAPPLAVARQIAGLARSFVAVDRHKATFATLAPFGAASPAELPAEHKILDVAKSGAMLAWEFFAGQRSSPEGAAGADADKHRPAPWFVRYVQDQDLNTYRLPHSLSDRVLGHLMSRTLDPALYLRYLLDDADKNGNDSSEAKSSSGGGGGGGGDSDSGDSDSGGEEKVRGTVLFRDAVALGAVTHRKNLAMVAAILEKPVIRELALWPASSADTAARTRWRMRPECRPPSSLGQRLQWPT
jgi:hypothetical protein